MELIDVAAGNENNLKYKMWKMVDDVHDLVLHGYGGKEPPVDCMRLPHDGAYKVALMYDDGDIPLTSSAAKTWFIEDLMPSLALVYFRERLPTHMLFVNALFTINACMIDGSGDGADSASELFYSMEIEWDEFDTCLVKLIIEGYLRIELSTTENVDNVLCSGYDVQFTCREFGAWVLSTFLPDAIMMLDSKKVARCS